MSQRLYANEMTLGRSSGKSDPAGGTPPAGSRPDAGLAAVEFALIAPLFLMLVFGIIGYGIYFGAWIAVRHAVSEGARAAVAGLSDAERESLAKATVRAVFAGYTPVYQYDERKLTTKSKLDDCPNCFRVTYTYDLSGLSMLSELLPMMPTTITASSTVPNGGY